jgi:hypothetical protein
MEAGNVTYTHGLFERNGLVRYLFGDDTDSDSDDAATTSSQNGLFADINQDWFDEDEDTDPGSDDASTM